MVYTDPSLPFLGFPSAKALADDTRRLFAEVIFVPNHLLPEDLRNAKQFEHGNDPGTDYRQYGATLGQIGRKLGLDKQAKTDDNDREAALAAHEARIREQEHRWYETTDVDGECEELAQAMVDVATRKGERETHSLPFVY